MVVGFKHLLENKNVIYCIALTYFNRYTGLLSSNLATEILVSLTHWNIGLVFNRVSLTSWGENAFSAMVDHTSRDSFIIKIPYRVDVSLHQPASHPVFSRRSTLIRPNLLPSLYRNISFLVALCYLIVW